jgi:hypothetical protein
MVGHKRLRQLADIYADLADQAGGSVEEDGLATTNFRRAVAHAPSSAYVCIRFENAAFR